MYSLADLDDIENAKLIETKKSFSFLLFFLFFLLVLFWIVPGILYLIYYFTKSDNIFIYAIKYKNNNIKRIVFKTGDFGLEKIRKIEDNNLFTNNNINKSDNE